MTSSEKQILSDGLARVAEAAAFLVAYLETVNPEEEKSAGTAKPEQNGRAAASGGAPEPPKEYTYTEVRAILAEKSRLGHRAEVKAILSRHGVQQLSDVRDPETFAAIAAEAEEIKDG